MNIYVGNLSPRTSEAQIRKAFEIYGTVGKISLNVRPPDDKAFGFCFVAMPSDDQATRAIEVLSGQSLDGFVLNVRESGVSL